MSSVEPRKTGLSVSITVGILVVLGVLAAAHRRSGPSDPGIGGAAGGQLAPVGTMSPMSLNVSDAYVNPLDPPPKAEWEVLPGCLLLPNKTNAAHHFHVKRGDDPFVFQLYYVEAPEVAGQSEDQVNEQSRYFGLAEKMSVERCADVLGELGDKARQAVESLIARRPLLVLTRWERRPDTHHFYALIFFQADDGTRRSLQEWLVENGFGSIDRRSLGKLPTGQTSEEFLSRLEVQERIAQQTHRGAWAPVITRR